MQTASAPSNDGAVVRLPSSQSDWSLEDTRANESFSASLYRIGFRSTHAVQSRTFAASIVREKWMDGASHVFRVSNTNTLIVRVPTLRKARQGGKGKLQPTLPARRQGGSGFRRWWAARWIPIIGPEDPDGAWIEWIGQPSNCLLKQILIAGLVIWWARMSWANRKAHILCGSERAAYRFCGHHSSLPFTCPSTVTRGNIARVFQLRHP